MRAPIRLLAAGAAALTAVACLAAPAEAAPAAVKTFANCTAVHRVYSGGIAKQGVKDNTVRSHGRTTHRKLQGNVKFSTPLYTANTRLDRDRDGIACEKG